MVVGAPQGEEEPIHLGLPFRDREKARENNGRAGAGEEGQERWFAVAKKERGATGRGTLGHHPESHAKVEAARGPGMTT